MLNRYWALAGCLFVLGIALLAVSVARGEGGAGIALFIPFFYGTGLFSSLGVLFIFLGMAAFFLALVRGAAHAGAMGQEDEEVTSTRPEAGAGPPAGASPPAATEKGGGPRVRGGGVVLIGPIPIVFGSDSSTARSLMLLAMGLMAMAIVFMILLALL